MWYRRHECGFRMALFFSAATAAGAFGGFLARAIIEMRGVGGLSGWQWIFIIEGLMTFVVGTLAFYNLDVDAPLTLSPAILAFWLMSDYPERAKFLTEEERIYVIARLELDRSFLADEFDMKYFWDALKDRKIYVHMFMAAGTFVGVYSYSLFLPTIIRDLGWTSTTAQLMSTPPYIVACIVCVGAGWWADKVGQRGIFMITFIAAA